MNRIRNNYVILQEYIVYMGDRPKGDLSVSSLHTSMLQAAAGRSLN